MQAQLPKLFELFSQFNNKTSTNLEEHEEKQLVAPLYVVLNMVRTPFPDVRAASCAKTRKVAARSGRSSL